MNNANIDSFFMRNSSELVSGLDRLIDHCAQIVGRKMKVLEIGSYRGESSEIFLKNINVSVLTCVDSWTNGYDDSDVASYITPMSVIENEFDVRLSPYFDRLIKIKGRSSDVHNTVEDSYDLVYIDADHTYEGCLADISNYKDKVVAGGFLCGHDYGHPSIIKAIEDSIGSVDCVFEDSSWIKRM